MLKSDYPEPTVAATSSATSSAASGRTSRLSLPLSLSGVCIYVTLAFLVTAFLLASSARAQAGEHLSDTDLGRKVMVDYIVHFAHHLQWPIEAFNGSNAPFRICVMGGGELVAPLAARLHRHRVQGRMVSLERVNDGEMLRARRCQIIVMEDMEAEQMLKAVGALEFFPVLTVSDFHRFAVLGGMVEFAGSGGNMALQLNKTRLDRAELKMGSSLFRLSRQAN